MKEVNEHEIIQGCTQGDSKYQKLFFERYYSSMFAICFRYSKDEDEAKDTLQLGFMKAFDNIQHFKKESSIKTWLTRIMINTAIDQLRIKNKQFLSSLSEQDYLIPEEEALDIEGVEALSPEEAVALLQKLPAGYRTIVNLYAIEGLSHKQISENLGISEGTSKSQLSKARSLLKKLVTNLYSYAF